MFKRPIETKKKRHRSFVSFLLKIFLFPKVVDWLNDNFFSVIVGIYVMIEILIEKYENKSILLPIHITKASVHGSIRERLRRWIKTNEQTIRFQLIFNIATKKNWT